MLPRPSTHRIAHEVADTLRSISPERRYHLTLTGSLNGPMLLDLKCDVFAVRHRGSAG